MATLNKSGIIQCNNYKSVTISHCICESIHNINYSLFILMHFLPLWIRLFIAFTWIRVYSEEKLSLVSIDTPSSFGTGLTDCMFYPLIYRSCTPFHPLLESPVRTIFCLMLTTVMIRTFIWGKNNIYILTAFGMLVKYWRGSHVPQHSKNNFSKLARYNSK